MASRKDQVNAGKEHCDKQGGMSGGDAPPWASGLKQLYDDVVEEPLPDSFTDLLALLDADDAPHAPMPKTQKPHREKGGA